MLLKVFGKEFTTKEGKKFIRYSYTNDGKVFYDVKFTRTCPYVPNLKYYVNIELELDDISIQKGNKKEHKNPIMWIRNFTKVIQIEDDGKWKEKRLEELKELLGE